MKLVKIKCPVLVLGRKDDKIVEGKSSNEIAEKLNCEIYMYEDYGHSAYEEAKDFNKRAFDFFVNY
ncbi:alpha/beta fold hydrolase [Treponema putidum]|uniref:alpha/beta fold hydrolase n=1 Tax=Treponema putidum TaxID=221027 RepID=UPI002103063B|nr:alpha/beta hydrolase [Treponema putidum]